eukprot:CAMPEP_0116891174 /NCGR_PEP_ID=MMETSP0467-20121206/1635_1 /TAXON_ID=283647 /ORGANISM="Mesodinium pulex, Strain SPMC105" /LENGTH=55 /DNA_ID=CAMNT_0004559515 /DNA_START=250 /DNA_END=417 /DNA_ORIENTATION=+
MSVTDVFVKRMDVIDTVIGIDTNAKGVKKQQQNIGKFDIKALFNYLIRLSEKKYN